MTETPLKVLKAENGVRSLFPRGGRNSGTKAYSLLTLGVAAGNTDVQIRLIVNGNPVATFIGVEADSTNTFIATFPASHLIDGGGNVIELHSRGEKHFFVHHVVVHFRQNT